MRKLRNLMNALAALKEWQEEVERAYLAAEQMEADYKQLLAEQEADAASTKKEAVVLDLAAYRALKATA